MQTISMPERDNLGLCCSFPGSCSNRWTRAAKEAGGSGDTAQQQRVVCHETASQGDLEEGMSNWLQLKLEHPGVQLPFP